MDRKIVRMRQGAMDVLSLQEGNLRLEVNRDSGAAVLLAREGRKTVQLVLNPEEAAAILSWSSESRS